VKLESRRQNAHLVLELFFCVSRGLILCLVKLWPGLPAEGQSACSHST